MSAAPTAFDKRLARAESTAALAANEVPIWQPLPGPQTMAYESLADVVGFGGAAGGGKTDLAVGKALTKHKRIAIFRRFSTEMLSIIDRVAEVVCTRDGLNSVNGIWRMGDRVIEFGSVPNADDVRKYQGRAKDLLVIDEAANFLEPQVRFLMGWVRTTDPKQHTQTLMCFNPPTNAEGRWIVDFFAPWLDKKHPNPAMPGELRWFAMVDGRETEVVDGEPFAHGTDLIQPQSRTFIPSRISDNPYLASTGYMATLQSLPEPLRSQMLHGDFDAGSEDDAMQVIPTAWVEIAQARWKKLDVKPAMDSVGVDVARGGKDNTVISRRHGWWFDELLTYPGAATPDGPSVAGLVIAALRDRAPIHLDVIGVGASPYDFLQEARQNVYGINVSESPNTTDKSGRLKFANLRSQLWWQMREALDPNSNNGIALPPDRRLLSDLCSPKWELRGSVVKVESREDIYSRIKRSPDFASALMLAMIDNPRLDEFYDAAAAKRRRGEYDPYEYLKDTPVKREYDPFSASWA
ncbi:terminase [Limnohabitans sp. Bal53]|uniref:terminase n=1 Tax=Limnohabitans sp. Bal53 TaxID=1977910 RepID=UPI0018EE7BBF|nr:terminase [Limnohabitans sp. Bal53]